MKISQEELHRAAIRAQITAEQSAALWRELEAEQAGTPGFRPSHIAYYFGALIVIGAMGWFMTRGWESLGGWGIAAIALGYAAMFLFVGKKFWDSPDTRIPGGLLVTVAVCMVPLLVYGVERALGFWPQNSPRSYQGFHPYIRASWLIMELCTVSAGTVALQFFEFPFLTAPIAYALWYMSMDLTPLLFGGSQWSWQGECFVSVIFGAVLLLVAYFLDRRTRLDYSFWGYLFGAVAFWCGLTFMNSHSEIGKFFYFLINLAAIALSALLQRKVFIVFGSLGVFGYLGHLAYSVFKDSVMFPFVLSVIGILIIYAGIKYQRNQVRVDGWLRTTFGRPLRS